MRTSVGGLTACVPMWRAGGVRTSVGGLAACVPL